MGDVALYKDTYKPLLLECLSTPVPQGKDYTKELEILKDILEKMQVKFVLLYLNPWCNVQGICICIKQGLLMRP